MDLFAMKVISWNINSLRLRLESLQTLILQEDPHIILLQETKVQDKDFPEDFFQQHFYNVAFWGQKSYNGVAIASKFPLEDIQRGMDVDGLEARYIEAFTGGIRVASVYVPNGKGLDNPSYDDKRLFFQRLRAHVRSFVDHEESVLLGGDFNVAVADEDVADAAAMRGRLLCSLPERQWMRELFHDGWSDSLYTMQGIKNPYTWWPYQGRAWEKNLGFRLDYCLLSPWGMDRLEDASVVSSWRGHDKPSDHCPISISLFS